MRPPAAAGSSAPVAVLVLGLVGLHLAYRSHFAAAAIPADVSAAAWSLYLERALASAGPVRVLAAPLLHGDPAHLAGNLAGLALFTWGLRGARPRPGLLAAIAVPALAFAAAPGPTSLGISAGVFSLAGLTARTAARPAWRALAGLWLVAGAVGGLVTPGVNQAAHLGGAVFGAVLGPRLPALGPGVAAGLVLGWIALGAVPSRGAKAAAAAVESATPWLRCVPLVVARVPQAVDAQTRRREALGAVLDAAKRGSVPAAATRRLAAALAASDIAAPGGLEDALRDLPADGEYARRWRALARGVPAGIPPGFLRNGGVAVTDDHKPEWDRLLAALAGRDAEVLAAARGPAGWRRRFLEGAR